MKRKPIDAGMRFGKWITLGPGEDYDDSAELIKAFGHVDDVDGEAIAKALRRIEALR